MQTGFSLLLLIIDKVHPYPRVGLANKVTNSCESSINKGALYMYNINITYDNTQL